MSEPQKPSALPLMCPACLAMDKPHASATIEINNGTATCISCGHTWPLPKDAV